MLPMLLHVTPVTRTQVLLFVPVIYSMIGFSMEAEKFLFYAFMFLASISFYTIFGQFMVYVTPSQQIAQVREVSRVHVPHRSIRCVLGLGWVCDQEQQARRLAAVMVARYHCLVTGSHFSR